jgi:hypothetical protein
VTTTSAPAKFAPAARCTCPRQPTAAVRAFTDTVRRLRAHIGQLPAELLTLPLLDVPCREKRCDKLVPILVGDLLGYE